jgi:hypothetical protein
MSVDVILSSLYNHLQGLSFPAGVVIHGMNAPGPLPTSSFISPKVLPATTAALALATTNQERGLLQVNIYTKKGSGELEAAAIAKAVIDGFPRNLQLTGVRIDEQGYPSASFFDGSWMITPVTIPYQNIA